MGNNPGFDNVLVHDLIPYIDAHYRTVADQSHRAMAGLSMGGMETHNITLAHLDTFSGIGLFSGGSVTTNEIASLAGSTNAVANMAKFKKMVKLVFISSGSRELAGGRGGAPGRGGAAPAGVAAADGAPGGAPAGGPGGRGGLGGRGGGGMGGSPQSAVDGLTAAGINAHFYVSPDTAHEFQSWRRSLREFAPLLSQNW